MAEIDTSSYPRPQPPVNPFDLIRGIGGAMDTLGNLEVGKAMQQGIGPSGQVDRGTVANLLRQTPAGAMKALPTMHAIEQLKSAGYQADQAGLESFQKRMAITHHLFSGLASKDKPSGSDVNAVAAQALDPALEGHKYGITMPVIMNALKQFKTPDGKWLPSAEIKKKALEIQTQAAATSEILQQHSPGYQVVDQGGNLRIMPTGTRSAPITDATVPKNLPPTTPVATPQGTKYMGEQPLPAGAPTYGGAPPVPAGPVAPPVPAGPAAALEPGFVSAAEGIAGAGVRSASALTEAADTSMQRKAMLGNLENDLDKFTSGPAADYTRVAKAWVNRNVPLPENWKFDPKSIASQEEFVKQAVQLAQSQFGAIGGTGTDAKFDSAFKTSPNETLSMMGNKAIIRLLKGNEDAILAKNKAWQKWKQDHGPHRYDQFAADFVDKFDPRVFQFKYMPQAEQQSYIDRMPNDEERFRLIRNIAVAHKKGWVSYPAPDTK